VSYHVVVTPTADAEAMEAFRWYAERSAAAAERWYAGLDKAIASLAESPGRFPASQDDSDALGREVRVLLHGRRRGVFRILYAIEGDTVWVLRIRPRRPRPDRALIKPGSRKHVPRVTGPRIGPAQDLDQIEAVELHLAACERIDRLGDLDEPEDDVVVDGGRQAGRSAFLFGGFDGERSGHPRTGLLVEDLVLILDALLSFRSAVAEQRDGKLGKVHLVLAEPDDVVWFHPSGSPDIRRRFRCGFHGSSRPLLVGIRPFSSDR
jgi:plasmid stabilization system protein ParE